MQGLAPVFLGSNLVIMFRQLHALVVDDEPHCRDYLCRQLERTCPSITVVQTAASAKEAERFIRDLAPDVVFMDIHMPHQTGLDLLDALADRDFYLVFTTAYDEYAVEALRKQAFDYLLKPIDRDDLQACARRILMHFYHHRAPGNGALVSGHAAGWKSSLRGKRHFVRHQRHRARGSGRAATPPCTLPGGTTASR